MVDKTLSCVTFVSCLFSCVVIGQTMKSTMTTCKGKSKMCHLYSERHLSIVVPILCQTLQCGVLVRIHKLLGNYIVFVFSYAYYQNYCAKILKTFFEKEPTYMYLEKEWGHLIASYCLVICQND